MTTQAETRTISLEYDLPHPPEKVWRALTDPALVKAWLMSTDLVPEVGRAFTFKAEPTPWWDGIVSCEVREVQLHRRLVYTWRALPLDTVVTWTLDETPSGGTKLRLEHSGFEPGHAFDGARAGWQRMLGDALPQVLGR
jgi:uncharacterized protein YndB with AHSA1/START domain